MEKINKNAIVGDKVRSYAMKILKNEIFDIKDEYPIEEVAGAAVSLAMALVGRGVNRELVHVPTPVSVFSLGLTWEAQSNSGGSWVRCSDEDASGIERCPLIFFEDPFKIDEEDVGLLLNVMNEAWFTMTQNR